MPHPNPKVKRSLVVPEGFVGTRRVDESSLSADLMLKMDATGEGLEYGPNAQGIWDVSGSDIYYNTGNVGIGTSSPSNLLDVFHTTATIIQLSSGAYDDFSINVDSDGFSVVERVGLSKLLTIEQGGNVGIGTTSPALYRKLHINDGDYSFIRLDSALGFNASIGVNVNGFSIYDDDSAAYRVVVDSSGNVGIGTTSPSVLLHVEGGGPATMLQLQNTGTEAALRFVNSANTGGYIRYTSSDLNFLTNALERMRITGDGNVGIGTTSPGNPLHVVSNSGTFASIVIDNQNASGFGLLVKANTGSTNYVADFRNTDNTNLMRIRGDGNVGIGTTSPTYKLEIEDDDVRLFLEDASAATSLLLGAGVNTGFIDADVNTGSFDLKVGGNSVIALQDGNINFQTLPTSASGLSAGDLFTQTATQLGGSGTTKVICIV